MSAAAAFTTPCNSASLVPKLKSLRQWKLVSVAGPEPLGNRRDFVKSTEDWDHVREFKAALYRAPLGSGLVKRLHAVVQLECKRRSGVRIGDDLDIGAGSGHSSLVQRLVKFSARINPGGEPVSATYGIG